MFLCARDQSSGRALVGLMAAAGIAIMPLSHPASAQNIFDSIFGGTQRALPDEPTARYEPQQIPSQPSDVEGVELDPGGPLIAYCVRLCDGRFFPIQAYRNASASEQCKAFCPASATKIFSGGGIEHAVAGDGRRYADLPNAFVYRLRTVAGCTCNGKANYGLAQTLIADDPTLRFGDIVATSSGLTIYRGRDSRRRAVFTPIESARLSKNLRNQLVDVKVTPGVSTGPPITEGLKDEASAIPGERPRLSVREQGSSPHR